jgi:hypothetical protein
MLSQSQEGFSKREIRSQKVNSGIEKVVSCVNTPSPSDDFHGCDSEARGLLCFIIDYFYLNETGESLTCDQLASYKELISRLMDEKQKAELRIADLAAHVAKSQQLQQVVDETND